MSSYRRFITYLFRYEKGEKKEQAGYAKVEQRQNTGRIDIYIKNCREGLVEIRPYFFAREVRVPIGNVPVKNSVAEGSFRFEWGKMQDMTGLVVPLGKEELLFSQWDDASYTWQELLGTQEKQPETEIIQAEVPVSDNQICQQSLPQKGDLAQQFQTLRQKIYPFQGDLSTWAIQAQLRDMKYLPKEYWRLSNNSFVLRGYFSYGSILIGYMDGQQSWFIGVPGVFCRQEKIIAGMFGFDHFRGQHGRGEKPGEFGYWYQLLNVV